MVQSERHTQLRWRWSEQKSLNGGHRNRCTELNLMWSLSRNSARSVIIFLTTLEVLYAAIRADSSCPKNLVATLTNSFISNREKTMSGFWHFQNVVIHWYWFLSFALKFYLCYFGTFKGTTWTQELVWMVVNNCNAEAARNNPLFIRSPFLESVWLTAIFPHCCMSSKG